MDLKEVLKDGTFKNNSIFIQLAGLCSTLAVTSTLLNLLAMRIAVTFALIMSNAVVSALRRTILSKVQIPAFIVAIATSITLVEMILHAYVPPIYEALGIFLLLIVVNYCILGEAEGFAYQNRIIPLFVDELGTGLGYTTAVLAMGFVRKLFGSGELPGICILPETYPGVGFLVAPADALVLLGFLIAAFRYLMDKKKKVQEEEMLNSIFVILVGTILVNNCIFTQLLETCPLLRASSKIEISMGMSIAVTFVVVFASVITWALQGFILDVLSLKYLQTVVSILVITFPAQFAEMVIKKMSPALYAAMSIHLPLVITNCVILGITVLNIQNDYGFIEALSSGLSVSIEFGLMLVSIAALRERLEIVDLPKPLQGVSVALTSAELMAMAFGDSAGLI